MFLEEPTGPEELLESLEKIVTSPSSGKEYPIYKNPNPKEIRQKDHSFYCVERSIREYIPLIASVVVAFQILSIIVSLQEKKE
jgi:hypothetical protein